VFSALLRTETHLSGVFSALLRTETHLSGVFSAWSYKEMA